MAGSAVDRGSDVLFHQDAAHRPRLDRDDDLLRRIGQNDEAAARQLIASKLPRVVGLAARVLHDRLEAEDVAQEAFIRICQHAERWTPGRARFDSFLHVVVLNLCRDRLRRRREVTMEMLPDVPDPCANAESAMINDQQAKSVAAAINALPARQREAILLVHYQELTGTEAASALEVSAEALESLLSRGRRSLRAAFAQ